MKNIYAFLLLSVCLITGCSEEVTKVSKTANPISTSTGVVLPFNTSIGLTRYSEKLMEKEGDLFNDEITRLHKLFDRHNSYEGITNLYTINESYDSGNCIHVDDDLFELFKLSIEMCELTEGYFNPCMGNLVSYWESHWEFGSGLQIEDPSIETMNSYLSSIPTYQNIRNIIELDESNKTVKFNKIEGSSINASISLGGIAKGYAIDKVANELDNTKPYLLSGGSSSVVINGDNPLRDNGYYNIGLTDPNNIYGSYLFINQYKGKNVLSISGDYQNYCFNEDGLRRHHILNPFTGYSENYYRTFALSSSSRADVLDALSTALYNINSDNEIIRIINKVEEYYHIYISFYYLKEVDGEIIIHGDAEAKSHMVLNESQEASFVLIGENE